MDRREMLAEYFALTISDSGLVESLPLLLRDYIPNLDNLPSFLMRLGPQVSIYLFVCVLLLASINMKD
jgi:DNA mismatch repair protein MLH1